MSVYIQYILLLFCLTITLLNTYELYIMYTMHYKVHIIYANTNWYKQKNILKIIKFPDVIPFSINYFNLGMYCLKVALSCRNVTELNDCHIIYCKKILLFTLNEKIELNS